MQTQPNKYVQVFLTAIGLLLLILSILINHYHPRNEGIATITHNDIYKMNLSVAQAPLSKFDAPSTLSNSVAKNFTQPQVIAAPQVMPLSHDSSVSAPVGTENLVGEASLPNSEDCTKIDSTQTAEVQKKYDQSYGQYTDTKTDPEHNNDNYQSYQNSLEGEYTTYRLAVLAKGCQPSQPAPAAIAQ